MSGPPVRIGVNALYLIPGQVGGTEIYLRSLLDALASIDQTNHYTIFTNAETGPDLVPTQTNFYHAPQDVHATFRPARILWEQIVLPFAARRSKIQVMFNPGFIAPFLTGCPNVTVFHDLQHKRHPEHFRWFDLPFWRTLLYLSALNSKRIVAVSQATAEDLAHFYGVAPERVTIVPHGVEHAFFELNREGVNPEPLLLCVSTLHPHKNLDGLLRAFAAFRRCRPEFRLIIAGLRGFYADELEHLRASLGLAESVSFTGWIPREALFDLYRRADAFIYPSRFEGFGMPILEALAAGIPSACSNVEPMKTVAGNAALLFDPDDLNSIRQALEQITCDSDVRRRLAAAGPERAAQFSWHNAAAATLKTLVSVV
jgi:glycosyltransferase involved in cell wall biosynthesis